VVLDRYSTFVSALQHQVLVGETNSVDAGINSGPETQLNEFGNRTDMTIKWILQLLMAIECDVFVGTRGVSKHVQNLESLADI